MLFMANYLTYRFQIKFNWTFEKALSQSDTQVGIPYHFFVNMIALFTNSY